MYLPVLGTYCRLGDMCIINVLLSCSRISRIRCYSNSALSVLHMQLRRVAYGPVRETSRVIPSVFYRPTIVVVVLAAWELIRKDTPRVDQPTAACSTKSWRSRRVNDHVLVLGDVFDPEHGHHVQLRDDKRSSAKMAFDKRG
jgi:hypothetical protein